MRDVLRHPPLIIGDPGFGQLFCGEARNQRGGTSWHADLNAEGQVLLRNHPISSSRVRMFFRHGLTYGERLRQCQYRPGRRADRRGDVNLWMCRALDRQAPELWGAFLKALLPAALMSLAACFAAASSASFARRNCRSRAVFSNRSRASLSRSCFMPCSRF